MSRTIDLAHEPSFALGRLTVLPAQREVVRDDGAREVLEHRVMQVLIALSKADGGIVTREELLASCWSGRVVGDDAINRVMSRLRRAADGIGAGSFGVETITKVGYRLMRPDTAPGSPPPSKVPAGIAPSRRTLWAAGLAVGVVGLAGVGTLLGRRLRGAETAETKALMAQAWLAWTQGTDEGNSQAIGLYRRALDAAPRSADGWGMLACAYSDRAQYWTRPSEREPVRARALSAGRQALDLDPQNAAGRVAVAYARPIRGNWLFMEQEFRGASTDQPDRPLGAYGLAVLLGQVGRFSDAAPLVEQVRHAAPTVNQYRHHIETLWGAGRLDEAERVLEEALSIYAANPIIWRVRFDLLLFGGRPRAAIAMLQDAEARPRELSNDQVDGLMRLAVAVETRGAAEVAAVADPEMRNGRTSAGEARFAIQNLSAVGRVDEAFAFADAYFFSRGFVIPDDPTSSATPAKTTLVERHPSLLFRPSTRAMRGDGRFGRLTAELGLERYWTDAKAAPDYRRGAA